LLTDDPPSAHDRRARAGILSAFAVFAAGYVVYSQTLAFHWDEGFHLLAARAIASGKTPYIDFIFPQAPLNAYWNAAWLCVFGDSWRATHISATVLLLGAIALTTQYLYKRFPDARWRGNAALVGVLLFGLNVFALEYGPIAQAYAFAMFMTAAALRASVAAVEKPAWTLAALAGLCAGAAACGTLLAAAPGPVFLAWILIYNQRGSRIAKLAGFAAGALAAFSPIVYLFAKGPRQAWFNLVQYQVIYRRVDWPGAGVHDVDVLTAWINRSQDLILLLLALGAVVLLRRASKSDAHNAAGCDNSLPEPSAPAAVRSTDDIADQPAGRNDALSGSSDSLPISGPRMKAPSWDRGQRAPFILCICICVAVGLQNGIAHPTFIQYFLPMTPAATILATVGLYALAIRIDVVDRPGRLIAGLACIFALGLGRGLFDDRESYTWRKLLEVAKKVEEVTPRNGTLLAEEQIYFITRRPAPPGIEFGFAHKLDLGAERNALLHIVPKKEMEARISARAYETDAICDDTDEVDRVDGLGLYAQKSDFGECTVFWSLKPNP
jgi:hypothetical protein